METLWHQAGKPGSTGVARHNPTLYAVSFTLGHAMQPRLNFRKKGVLCILAASALLLPGCASVSESMTRLGASSTTAFAVVDGRVLHGEARLSAERSGSVHLQSTDTPALSCFGPLSYTATTQGLISLSCSNGRAVAVSFQAYSPLSGVGRGSMEKTDMGATSRVDFNLTYGLKADRAAAYLAVPVASLMPPAASASAMAPVPP